MVSMSRIRRDPNAFDNLWNAVILRWYREHASEPGLSMPDPAVSKTKLMDVYHYLNRYCSESYMDNSESPLNQRKIAACLLFAISSTRPISVDQSIPGCTEQPMGKNGIPRKGSMPFFANERLAISTAVSVILSYLEHAVDDHTRCSLTIEQRASAKLQIDHGIDLLEDKDGGEWLLNFEKALALTAIEGNINIPLASCLVAYLEATVLDNETYCEVLKAFDRAATDEWGDSIESDQ